MASPIGFSVGDVIAGIQLAIRVFQALQESGRSKAEHQSAVAYLELLKSVFSRLERSETTDALSHESIRYLEATIQVCREQVDLFLGSMRKYDPVFSGSKSDESKLRRSVRMVPSKLRWTLRTKDDLSKLQAEITPHLLNIIISLQIGGMGAHSQTQRFETTLLEHKSDKQEENGPLAQGRKYDLTRSEERRVARIDRTASSQPLSGRHAHPDVSTIKWKIGHPQSRDFQVIAESLEAFFVSLL